MRMIPLVLAGVLAAALGAVQLASSAAFGDLATRPSLPAALHARPGLLRWAIGGPYARAQAAVHDGDAAAAALVAALPDDARSADLRGQLALREGRRDAAIDQFVRAGDMVRAQRLIDALAQAQPARALAYQQRLLGRLGDDTNASEDLGQAWWRLGQLQALSGWLAPARRSGFWHDAQRSYERALRIAPNEETYLLAAGYQALANGDAPAALRWYRRAAQVVPDSADAYGGLASVAAVQGDCARAAGLVARSRALRGASGRDVTADPLFGPALLRCTRT